MLKVHVAVLLKIPRGVSRSFLLRCCGRFLQGFAEGSYRGLPKVPTAVLLKAPTGVCRRFLRRCWWRFKSSGILLCVVGSDILKHLEGSWPGIWR